MKINYVDESSKLLSKLERVDIPVEIYEMAEKCKIQVLFYKGQDEDDSDSKNPKGMFLSREFAKQVWNSKNSTMDFPWPEADYYLFINSKNSLERRLLTAYYIAKSQLAENENDPLVGDVIQARIPTNTEAYYLALYLLMPNDDINAFLRETGLSASEAIASTAALTNISGSFLASKVDVVNRLKLSEEINYDLQ